MFIYQLVDRNSRKCYVGSSASPLRSRLDWHIAKAQQGDTAPVSVWIRGLLAFGRRPRIERVAQAETSELAEIGEELWMTRCRATGFELINHQPDTWKGME